MTFFRGIVLTTVLLLRVDAFAPFSTPSSRSNSGHAASVKTLQNHQHTQLFASSYEYALLFDCDGVILETEELHRLAYNAAFKQAELTIDGKPVEWSVEYYGKHEE